MTSIIWWHLQSDDGQCQCWHIWWFQINRDDLAKLWSVISCILWTEFRICQTGVFKNEPNVRLAYFFSVFSLYGIVFKISQRPLYYAALPQLSRPLDRGRISRRFCPSYPDSPDDSFVVYRHCVIALVALDYSGTGWSQSEIWYNKTKRNLLSWIMSSLDKVVAWLLWWETSKAD